MAKKDTGSEKKEFHILLAGKSGAGKSTLMSTVFDIPEETDKVISPTHITENTTTRRNTRNDVTIIVTDTKGLVQESDGKVAGDFAKMKEETSGKADILLFCIPVGPSAKFTDTNPAIMKALQNEYGKKVWKNCILICTFSNLAWDTVKKKVNNEHDAISKYKKHIREYATLFKKQLVEVLGIENVNILTVFARSSEQPTKDQITVVAIPAGDSPDDPILPGLEYQFITQAGDKKTHFANWKETIYSEVIRKCEDERIKKMLVEYNWGPAVVKAVFQTTCAVSAGVRGAGMAAIGYGIVGELIAGPPGAVAGLLIGTVDGGIRGVIEGVSFSKKVVN